MVSSMILFAVGAVVSLATSWVVVGRIERVGERLNMSEGLLGMVAALAADAPEITTAVTAVSHHEHAVGAGVVLGSNVFNLAALLGLAAILAGRTALHRRVVLLGGAVSVAVAAVATATVVTGSWAAPGLAASALVVGAYAWVLATRGRGRLLPAGWSRWLASAVAEEEMELEQAIRPRPGTAADVAVSAGGLLVVVVASTVMERAASELGQRWSVPGIVVGGLVLAAVTSLPNAVSGAYLGARGRGAALLSTTLNSNNLNVVAGLLLPAAVTGLAAPSGSGELVVAWYAALTLVALALAWVGRGLSRRDGIAIVAAYVAFVAALVALA
ncbi:MAG TPA: hypothetical protein VFP54_01765 [Acidimicrobiales bacterium]|nr:hypothetical protein [Acidimicrobiales bacterium]